MVSKQTQWTEAMIFEEAKKFKTRSEFRLEASKIYQAAHSRGILGEVCSHMVSIRAVWTQGKIRKAANRVSNLEKFRKTKSYQAALRREIVADVCSHMLSK